MKRPNFVLCFLILAVASFAVVLPSSAGTLVMKYAPDGERLWVVADDSEEGIYDAMAFLDPQGNLYVDQYYYLAKYRPDGTETWRYDDEVRSWATDSLGNLFVPCGEHCVSKLDPRGIVLWEQDLGKQKISSITVDVSDNLLLHTYRVFGIDKESGQIMKFTTDGKHLWTFDYYASGDVDVGSYIHEVYADQQGNFYFYSMKDGLDGLAKFDGDANLVWRAGLSDVYPEFITLDEEGNVYVASGGNYVGNLLPGATFAVAKVNAAGEREWTRSHNWWPGSDYGSTLAGIALTPDGGLTIVGYAGGWSTIVFSPDGEEVWAAQLSDYLLDPLAVSVDANGNVISVGQYCTCGEEEIACCEMVVVKYLADGTWDWGTTYNHPADDRDEASAVATDEEGNIYVVGRYGYADDDLDENEGCGC